MRPFLFLLFSSFLFSCENPPKETRAERIAASVCDCTAQLLSMNQQAAADTGKVNFEAIQAEFEKSKACIFNQHMKPEDLPEVKSALAKKCPQLANEAELTDELMDK